MDKKYDNDNERIHNQLSLNSLLELSKNLDKNTLLFSEMLTRINQHLFPDKSIEDTWYKNLETLSEDIIPKLSERFKNDLSDDNVDFAELEINCYDDYFRIDILIDKQNPNDSSISLSHSSESNNPQGEDVYRRFKDLQGN